MSSFGPLGEVLCFRYTCRCTELKAKTTLSSYQQFRSVDTKAHLCITITDSLYSLDACLASVISTGLAINVSVYNMKCLPSSFS